MSDDAMDFLDLMGREGPCFHCGIDYTPLWRSGPPEKPVLCNACGSRWKTKGTLEGYIPKRAIKDAQSSQSSKLSPKFVPTSSIPGDKPEELQFVSNAAGQDHFSPFLGGGTNFGSSSSSETIFSKTHSNLQAINEATQPPPTLWDQNDVSKKKRSILEQRVLSPTERLHQQLYNALQDSEFTKQSDVDKDDDEDVLIFERVNHYIPENEIGLGCMLLKQPLSPPKGSKTESTSMLKSSSYSKESKLESSHGLKIATYPAGDNNLESCLIEVPMKDSSQDEIIALDNENSLAVSKKMKGLRNDYHHHMITRLRVYAQ